MRPGPRLRTRLTAAALAAAFLAPAPASATAAETTDANPPYRCAGYSSLPADNPLPQVMADMFRWGPYPATRVGDGQGDIDWTLDPHRNVSWGMWFHSLRWIGAAIVAGEAGDAAALERATTIARDWVSDNPYPWRANASASEPTMHRANVLLCLRQAHARVAGGRLPARVRWIDDALVAHAAALRAHHTGGSANHGTDESIALLGIGCVLRRQGDVDLAASRLSAAITRAIDAEGATNEQSTGYASFNHALWGRAQNALTACAPTSPALASITARRARLAEFMAHSHTPFGWVHQLGDTQRQVQTPVSGSVHEYAVSRGRRGSAPRDRVKVYAAGYVFGRSGWGTGRRPFAQESAYSLRFGPGRINHGHSDHMSITWQTRGQEILADTGFAGYQRDPWVAYTRSAEAHSQLVIPGMAWQVATRLTRAQVAKDGRSESFRLVDAPGAGMSRVRDVVVLHDPDVMVVTDRAAAPRSTTFSQTWQLPAGGRTTVVNRGTGVVRVSGAVKTTVVQVPVGGKRPPTSSTRVVAGATRPIRGWQWTTMTHRRPAPSVAMTRRARSTVMTTAVIASGSGERVAVSSKPRGAATLYTVTVGRRVAQVVVAPDGSATRLR